MEKFLLGAKILVGTIILVGLSYLVIESLKPKYAGIFIDTVPASFVFIDGKEVGKTPYRGIQKPGEVVVKLLPSSEKPFLPYETKTKLIAGVETVVKYGFAETIEGEEGEIITFERDERSLTTLLAISSPDSSIVVIDGRERSFAPFKTTSILPGDHQLKFILDDYKEKTVKVKVHKGYRLTAYVKLARTDNSEPVETENVNITPAILDTRDKVEILSTPMGYLRIRSEPSSNSDEIGQVNTGEKYPIVEVDTKSGWFRIEYVPETAAQSAKLGWVSNQYAKRISTISVTPTITLISPLPTENLELMP